jgi:hypothetical protein
VQHTFVAMFTHIPFMGSGVWVVVAVVVVLVLLMRRYSADVYDIIITRRLTTPWYRAVLSELDNVSGVLRTQQHDTSTPTHPPTHSQTHARTQACTHAHTPTHARTHARTHSLPVSLT